MSLIKFLLGTSLGQRKRWKHEEEKKSLTIKVNLADPEKRRELMNCIAFSPGIPSDDRRYVDLWGDDSLTISESSLVSDNVVTIVEVHAAVEDDRQDAKIENDAPDDDELEEHKIELDKKEALDESVIKLEVQETVEAQADSGDYDESNGNKEQFSEQEVVEEEEQVKAENAVQADEEDILNETSLETDDLNEGVELIAEIKEEVEASDCESTEGDVTQADSSTAGPLNSEEEELLDQIVPELPGSENSTRCTTLTPALSIEMHTQTDELISPADAARETETQTDEPSSTVPAAVSRQQNHFYTTYCDPREMQLLSAALDELQVDMEKTQTPTCNCCGSVRPSPPTPNLSFSTEKNRDIARENANLLSRLQRTHVRVLKHESTTSPPESSASINRRKQHQRIQRENLILLRKITAARGKGRGRNSTLLSYY